MPFLFPSLGRMSSQGWSVTTWRLIPRRTNQSWSESQHSCFPWLFLFSKVLTPQVIPAYSLQYFTISRQAKGSSKLSKWGNNSHFVPKQHTKGSDFPFLSDSRAGLGALLHPFDTRCLDGPQGLTVGYSPCAVQVLSLNHLMLLCPENLLLSIILVTFSSVTHFCAFRRGWHVAGFMDGVLHVLGSALMCCNSLCSH